MPPADSQPPQDDSHWENELRKAEESLINLRRRYYQLQRDRDRKQKLEHQLKQLQSELDSLEYNLESKLVTWKDFAEPFWLAVRFGGLGLILGWILKSCAG